MKELKEQFVSALLVILTVAAVIASVINFQQQHRFRLPDDGVVWVDRHATVEALWDRARALLGASGFLNPQNPEHILADFRRLLARADPTQREVELLAGALKALERILRQRGDGR